MVVERSSMKSLDSRLWWHVARMIEAPMWGVVRWVYGVRVERMEFVDLRVGRENDGVQTVLAAALAALRAAGSEFDELVRSELRFVAGAPIRTERVAPWLRSYSSPFRGFEASNVQYLATRLVWATASRAYRLARPHPTEPARYRSTIASDGGTTGIRGATSECRSVVRLLAGSGAPHRSGPSATGFVREEWGGSFRASP